MAARTKATGRATSTNRVSVQPINASLSFNGTSSLMTSAVVPDPNGFSFGFWIKTTGDSGASTAFYMSYNSAVSTDGVQVLRAVGSGTLDINLWNGTSGVVGRFSAVMKNRWTHIAFTYLPSRTSVMYVNGIAVSSQTAAGTMTAAAGQSLTFGKRSYVGTFTGCLMQQIVWQNTTTPWTPQQVMQLYQQGIAPSGATFVLPLTEGAGTTAYDISGNANNGTITAGTHTSDTPSKARQLVGGNLVSNGAMSYVPPAGANVATTTGSRFIDGTVGGSTTNNLFGWAIAGPATAIAGIYDTTVLYNGLPTLKISNTNTTGRARGIWNLPASNFSTVTQAQLSYLIPCLPNTAYILSGWIKTNNTLATTPLIAVELSGSGAVVIANSSTTTGFAGTNDWYFNRKPFTTSSTTSFLGVYCANDTAGNISDAWFANIQLTPTTNTVRGLV